MDIGPDTDLRAVSDEELALSAKSGAVGAFDLLSERYAAILRTRAYRYSRVVGIDTEDFVQEGMLALFKAVKSFNTSLGIQFKTYATACINNSMASAIKKHFKTTENTGISIDVIDEEAFSESSAFNNTPMLIEDMYIKREDSALLALHIKSLLSDFERQVLRLYLRGHSYIQIAELLSTTTKAVDNALQRVRRKLRPEL